MNDYVDKNQQMQCNSCTWTGNQQNADVEPDGALICPNCGEPLVPAT